MLGWLLFASIFFPPYTPRPRTPYVPRPVRPLSEVERKMLGDKELLKKHPNLSQYILGVPGPDWQILIN